MVTGEEAAFRLHVNRINTLNIALFHPFHNDNEVSPKFIHLEVA